MTTYINDPLRGILEAELSSNPVYNSPWLKHFGSPKLMGVMNPVTHTFDYPITVGKGSYSIGIEPSYPEGADAMVVLGQRQALYFDYAAQLSDMEYRSYMSDPSMRNLIAAKVKEQLMQSQGAVTLALEKMVSAYTATDVTGQPGISLKWVGLLNKQAATGTVSNPEDINSTAGTATAKAYNLTGTNKSLDFVVNTFGSVVERFRTFVDSNSGTQMLDGALDSNEFIHFVHPRTEHLLKSIHPLMSSVTADQTTTYAKQLEVDGIVPGIHKIVSSPYMGIPAPTESEDGTHTVITVANPKKNLYLGVIKPWYTDGWEKLLGSQNTWRIGYHQQMVCIPRPFYINGSYKKAVHHWTFVHFNDAG